MVCLLDKTTDRRTYLTDCYGDSSCGLIAPHHRWVAVGGEHLFIWTADGGYRLAREAIRWVHALRLIDANTLDLLTDPWSATSAVWRAWPEDGTYEKRRTFGAYKNRPYTGKVVW